MGEKKLNFYLERKSECERKKCLDVMLTDAPANML